MIQQKYNLKRKFIASALGCFVLLTPSISLAWGGEGHRLTAQIAFDYLNPNAKKHVDLLLARPIEPLEMTTATRSFVAASTWADAIRVDPNFQKYSELHFIDRPFPDGGPVATPNIVTALNDYVKILQTSKDEDAQAQALRFIIHFVGDIHDPVHCATRIDAAHPEGDRGGNLVKILITDSDGKPQPRSLHSYWDAGLDSFPKDTSGTFSGAPDSSIRRAATLIKRKYPDLGTVAAADPFDFQGWADESFQLAKNVYAGILNGGRVTATYKARGINVVNQQVAKGGYRLARLLNTIWP